MKKYDKMGKLMIGMICFAIIGCTYFVTGFIMAVRNNGNVLNQNQTQQNQIEAVANTESYDYEKCAYNALNEQEQRLYQNIEELMKDYQTAFISIEDWNPDMVIKVNEAIYQDNPLAHLYLNVNESYDAIGNIEGMRITYAYDWNPDEEFNRDTMNDTITRINACCDDILGKIDKNSPPEEQYLNIAKQLCEWVKYDNTESSDTKLFSQSLYGTFLRKKALCTGYAYGYQYLCKRANLWCIPVSGSVDGQAHMWNLIKTSHGTYYVDTTLCDTKNKNNFTEDYFMMTWDKMLKDHILDEGQSEATGK